MNRSPFKHNLTLLAAMILLWLAASSPCIAADAPSTVSGPRC